MATDKDGGVSAVLTHTITIVDLTAPVIAAHGNEGPFEATSAAGATVTFADATATDNSGAAPTITYSQASGSVFAIGTTTVTITATDAAANASSLTFTVTVADTTAPAVTPPGNVTVHATSPSGASVAYAAAGTSDAVGVVSVTYSTASGALFANGTTTVTVTARDAANNAGTGSFTVTVTPLTAAEVWRYWSFGTADATGDAADNADPDRDGVVNLLERAFDTDPLSATSGSGALQYAGTFAGGGTLVSEGTPRLMAEGSDVRALFIRRSGYAAQGLGYVVEFSANLGTWQASADAPTVLADNGSDQVVSVPYPALVAGQPARFFRVVVSAAP